MSYSNSNNPYARRPTESPYESYALDDSQNFDEKYSNSPSRQGYYSSEPGNYYIPPFVGHCVQ